MGEPICSQTLVVTASADGSSFLFFAFSFRFFIYKKDEEGIQFFTRSSDI